MDYREKEEFIAGCFDWDKVCTLELVNGVEGQSLYINDYRIAGKKPWGGGTVVKTWKNVTVGDVVSSLIDFVKEPQEDVVI